jgi:hypothetical protein
MHRLRPIAAPTDTATLKLLAVFCGVGLIVSLLLAGYGLDLSPGFL